MIKRAHDRFGLWPERLAADSLRCEIACDV
jgi:hypothetical protein